VSKRELIDDELRQLPDRDLEKLHAENAPPTLAAESALAKDWLAPEEDAAWASL
jgi:hypothetical protein